MWSWSAGVAGLLLAGVVQAQVSDTTPPELLDFQIGPLVIDAAAGDVILNVRIEARDDLAGFGSGSTGNGSIDVRHEGGSNPIGSGSLPITSGTDLQPVFEFTLQMPRYSPKGRYPIQITLIDNVFNSVTYSSEDLVGLVFPGAVEVVSEGDTTPPELIAFSVSPLELNTSFASATLQVQIVARDDLSGFGSGSTGNGSIDVRHEGGSNPFGSGSLPITGGTDLEPVFEFSLTAPQNSPEGRYPIQVTLIDNLFNSVSYDSAQLETLGLPGSVQIVSISDTTPPELIDFTITPTVVEATGGVARFQVRIEARDDLAGFGSGSTGNGSIDIRHQSGASPFGRGSLPITGGTDLEPVFEFELELPEFSPLGEYPIQISLIDNVFNSANFDADALAGLGLPAGVVRQVTQVVPDLDAASLDAVQDASGRFVVFQSNAVGLVAGDDDGRTHILRVDSSTGEVARISVDDAANKVDGDSIEPSVSADGQLVVFVAPDAGVVKLHREPKAASAERRKGGTHGVFLRNVLTGTTHRVGSGLAAGQGTRPRLSADGSAVVFTSVNLDPAVGKPDQQEVFLVPLVPDGDLRLPSTPTCVSCKAVAPDGSDSEIDSDGPGQHAVVSADGTWVAWQSAAGNALVGSTSPCPQGTSEILMRNMLTGAVQRVGSPPDPADCGEAGSRTPELDFSGRRVVFESDHGSAGAGGAGQSDVMLFELGRSAPIRLSVGASGEAADAGSTQPSLSGDGRTVVFVSHAGNLDPEVAATKGEPAIFAYSLRDGRLHQASLAAEGETHLRERLRPRLDYTGLHLVSDSAALVAEGFASSVVFQRVNRTNADVVFESGFE